MPVVTFSEAPDEEHEDVEMEVHRLIAVFGFLLFSLLPRLVRHFCGHPILALGSLHKRFFSQGSGPASSALVLALLRMIGEAYCAFSHCSFFSF